MDDTLTFGAWVKRRRKELGLTQEKLALAAHCSWDMVRKIESGSARPSKSMAEGLLAALAVPVEAHAALVHLARRGNAAEPQAEPQQQAATVAVATATLASFQLPDPPTTFVGREDAISAIVTRLREPGVRLLTLSGPGGVGKTRLALQVARASGEDYADGAYFVDLAPLDDPALVGAAIARTLGLSEAPGESPLETLSNGLRGKNLLLLLDNFEQVLDAAPLVGGLLQAAPRVKVLLTSRTPLHIYAEKEFAVGPLTLPGLDPPPSVEQLRASEAVQLFVERATAVKADFALTAANALAVAQVCARLDGLPLAIELAAARTKLLPPAALLTRLDARLRLLTGGARDLPARQQTLRSAIDWSYDLLDPAEKQLFSRLAVFSGGATLEAIEAIAVAPDLALDALDGVESLLDKSLLRSSETAAGEPRFWMLETIGEYAAERLRESGVADDVRAAHANYYLALADTAQAQLLGPEQHGWLQRLGDETANFREVFTWAGHSGDIALGLRLGVALWRYWQMRGTINEGRGWLEPLLQRADDVPVALRAAALQGAGSLAWNQGDYRRADDFLTRGLALQRQLDDPAALATVLMPLGNTKRDLGEYEQAAAYYAEAQAAYRSVGNLRGIAVTLNNQGIMARRQGDYQRSIALCEESLAIRRQLGDSWGISISLMMIGEGAAAQGDYRRAKVYLGESLAIRRRLDDNRGIAEVVYMLAHVAGKLGDQEERLRCYVESLRLFKGMGDMVSTGNCLQALAPLVADRGQPRLAALLFGAAEQLIASRGGQLWSDEVATIEGAFARLRQELGDDGFDAAFAAGAALSADEATSTALSALGQ